MGDFGHDETVAILRDRRNWGRWGDDDERGTVNLITEEKRRQAAGLVRTGRSVSLSRVFPVDPSPVNPRPALHFMRRADRGDSGSAADFYGVLYHGTASTHLDALCHLWGPDGIYGGRSPDEVIGIERATFGDVDQYRDGIITRGVLLDVPAYRGEEFVTQDRPVQGDELAAICEQGGFSVEPGDAIVVYSGREAWGRHAGRPWGSGETTSPPAEDIGPDRPGLHASCLQFIRDTDCAVLVWDMMDAFPNGVGVRWSVHAAIYAFGLALVDNALLEPLAQECRASGRHDFMLVVSPLRVVGGTGSPANPLAVL